MFIKFLNLIIMEVFSFPILCMFHEVYIAYAPKRAVLNSVQIHFIMNILYFKALLL